MHRFSDLATQYNNAGIYNKVIQKRGWYSIYRYSTDELINTLRECDFIGQAQKIYDFYENHPDSDVRRPEVFNISQIDVVKYYYDNTSSYIKALSKQIRYGDEFIPDLICEDKFENKVLQHPTFVLIGILWAVWVALLIFTATSALSVWQVIFIIVIGTPLLIISLGISLIALQYVLVFIYNNLVMYQHERFLQRKSNVANLRHKQIIYLVEKN